MKRTLLAGTTALMALFNASAVDCGYTEANVCDEEKLDLTGAWLGAGVIVDFDKYDADISVAAEYEGLQDVVRSAQVSAAGTNAGKIGEEGYSKIYEHLATANAAVVNAGDIPNTTALALGVTSADRKFGFKKTYFAHRTLKLKKTKTVAGGELKGSLFYNVDNGLVFGVDLSLGLTAKSKKTIDGNGQFAVLPATLVADTKIYAFTQDTDYDTTVNKALSGDTPTTGGAVVTSETLANNAGTLGTKDNVLMNFSFVKDSVVAANAGATVCDSALTSFVFNRDDKGTNVAIAADVNGKVASAEFEKDIFSPTFAFVVGGYFKGFFGGLRLGMNYMTGKVHNLKNANGTYVAEGVEHKVRQVSPVIGLQLMKHIKKGVFAYLTYDHMFGINKTFLDSPIKKFKRRQNRISLGLGYQFKTNH